MTFPDIGRMLPVMAWLRPREVELNRRLVEAAARYDVPVLDLFPLEMCGDPELWSHDRIHGSSEGHTRIAAGMAQLLGLPGSDQTGGPRPGPHWGARRRTTGRVVDGDVRRAVPDPEADGPGVRRRPGRQTP